jgi:hypothetical protein
MIASSSASFSNESLARKGERYSVCRYQILWDCVRRARGRGILFHCQGARRVGFASVVLYLYNSFQLNRTVSQERFNFSYFVSYNRSFLNPDTFFRMYRRRSLHLYSKLARQRNGGAYVSFRHLRLSPWGFNKSMNSFRGNKQRYRNFIPSEMKIFTSYVEI